MRAAPFKFKKVCLTAVLIVGGLIGSSFAALPVIPEDPAGALRWKESRQETIQESVGKPPDEAISTLGQMARQLGTLGYRDCPEKREIQEAVIQRLLSIPGHAEFYAKRIKGAQTRFEGLVPEDNEYGSLQAQLLDEQMYGFETLRFMPSPETVRVLGEFLFDPWGLDPHAKPGEAHGKDNLGQSPHASRALKALALLPLETRANATPPEATRYWENIDAWKLWYQQIRAGTRTFRFKGDPQEYSLTGPVTKTVEPVAGSQQSGGVRPTSLESEGKQSKLRVGALLGAIALLGAAIWVAMKKRSSVGAG